MSKTKGKEKMREAVRVTRIQVREVAGNWTDTVTRWFETMGMVRRAANLFYETWLVWHVQNQSREQLEAWLTARQADKVAAGKCPVVCMPAELSKIIYAKLIEQFPQVHNRVLGLLQNRLASDIKTKVASQGSLPGWSATLLHLQGIPSITRRDYPVPFDARNSRLSVDGEQRVIELATWRIPRDGKAATSITDRVILEANGRKCQRVAKEFDNIVSGVWEFKGSSLVYDDKKRKWFVLISYQCPSRVVPLNPDTLAYLVPGRNVAFYVRQRGQRSHWLQGRGGHITAMRERVWRLRAEKSTAYRYVLNRKGHGLKHAGKWRAQSSQTWRQFVKRINHAVSKQAVDWCIANGVGTLVYFQPSGTCSENRFVSGSYKNSTWEFHALKTMLDYKCNDRGIGLKVVQVGKFSQESKLQKKA